MNKPCKQATLRNVCTRTTLECCTLVVSSALLMGALFPQNHNRSIVYLFHHYSLKAVRVIIVFRSKSLASALFARLLLWPNEAEKNHVYVQRTALLLIFDNGLCGSHLWLATMSSVTFKIVNSRCKNIGVRVSQVNTRRSVSDGVALQTFHILCKHLSAFF